MYVNAYVNANNTMRVINCLCLAATCLRVAIFLLPCLQTCS